MTDVIRSIGFLSRLPVSSRFYENHNGAISNYARAFPAAGLLLAVPPALLLWILLQIDAPPLLAALICLLALTLITGALHEDGLADSADGLAGGRDREHMLAIMRDSCTGSYGVIALIFSFSIRAAALCHLIVYSQALAVLAVLAVQPAARALMVAHWHALPAARGDGVASGAGQPDSANRRFALVSSIVVVTLLLISVASLAEIAVALVASGLAVYGFSRYVMRKIGGHTGDTIGASEQTAEIVFLSTLALWI